MELAEQVRLILGELRATLGARRASVVPRGAPDPGIVGAGGLRTLPLGHGARLELELGALVRPGDEVDVALEQAVRALRAVARDAALAEAVAPDAAGELPAVTVVIGGVSHSERVAERVHTYLRALSTLHGGQNALCVVRGEVVAASQAPTELERSRAELLVRRTQAAARATGHTHGDLVDPDAYVLTFWLSAALVVYFAGPYSADFVRHRARAVARELTDLLPELEPDPAAPAAVLRPPP